MYMCVSQYVLMHQAIWCDSEQATCSKYDLCIMSKRRRLVPWQIPLSVYLEKHEGRYHNGWGCHLLIWNNVRNICQRPMQHHRNSHVMLCCLASSLCSLSLFWHHINASLVHVGHVIQWHDIAQHASRLPVNGIVISNGMGFASSTSDAGGGRKIKILVCDVEKVEESVSISTVFLLIKFLSVPYILDCSLLHSLK